MNVLFINHCLTGGGSEKAMTLIANYFVSQGIKTSMVLLNENKKTYTLDSRVEIIECYCPMTKNKLLWHIKRIRTIRKVLKTSEAKTIITFMWDINMNVIIAALGLGKKIIASERCDPHNESRKLIKFAIYCILPFASHTVFQTPIVQSYYPRRVQKKSSVIPNAISDMIPMPDRTVTKKEIVAVGRMTEQKNFELLIRAFAKFSETYEEYTLVIYGDGPLKEALLKYAKKLGIFEKLYLPGYVEDVNNKMLHATAYVNCSNYEGISNAMLEAMAMGIPCVCTDCPVGGAAMFIKNEINGILVPVNDDVALCNAMKKIAGSPTFALELSEKAQNIRKRLNIKNIGKQWVDLCD